MRVTTLGSGDCSLRLVDADDKEVPSGGEYVAGEEYTLELDNGNNNGGNRVQCSNGKFGSSTTYSADSRAASRTVKWTAPASGSVAIKALCGDQDAVSVSNRISLTQLITPADTFCADYDATCASSAGAWSGCVKDVREMTQGRSGIELGDNWECRRRALARAKLSSGATRTSHCAGAAKAANAPCIDNADTFCERFAQTCAGAPGAGAWASDSAACRAGAGSTIFGSKPYVNDGTDTLGCRMKHLQLAEGGSDLNTNCGKASDDGGGRCVAPPTTGQFCEQLGETCGSDAASGCSSEFGELAAGKSGVAYGDTRACRMIELGKGMLASGAARTSHCAAASAADPPTAPCADTAETFCERFAHTCAGAPGAGAWASDSAACRAGAGSTIFGSKPYVNDGTDTLGCRMKHLQLAEGGSDLNTNCGKASDDGGGRCVAPPTTGQFCEQLGETCGSDAASGCSSEFGELAAGKSGVAYGATQACRVARLSGPSGAMATTGTDRSARCSAAAEACVDDASTFCRRLGATCDDALPYDDCVDAAHLLLPDAIEASSGTLQCRLTALLEAEQAVGGTTRSAACAVATGTDGDCVGIPSRTDFCHAFGKSCQGTPDGAAWLGAVNGFDTCVAETVKMITGSTDLGQSSLGQNTFACRVWALISASDAADKASQCTAASTGGGPAGPAYCSSDFTGEAWCQQYAETCGEAWSSASCAAAWDSLPEGSDGDSTGNSQACRVRSHLALCPYHGA